MNFFVLRYFDCTLNEVGEVGGWILHRQNSVVSDEDLDSTTDCGHGMPVVVRCPFISLYFF